MTGVVRIAHGRPEPQARDRHGRDRRQELEVLNKTDNPPFLPDDIGASSPNEELRLKLPLHRSAPAEDAARSSARATR